MRPSNDNEPYSDPSRAELVQFLGEAYPELEDFDREEAIWWYAHYHHTGQTSQLYSVLSTSEFKPGLAAIGPEDGSLAWGAYRALIGQFGPEKERS